MTTYPADAIEAALKAFNSTTGGYSREELPRNAMANALAAFDAAMLAHGWKRVWVAPEQNTLACHYVFNGCKYPGVCDQRGLCVAAPEVKP